MVQLLPPRPHERTLNTLTINIKEKRRRKREKGDEFRRD
jgi:hypothetical protein